jgi:cullin-4
MKTRKTLAHAQLISEVFAQLKFPISVRTNFVVIKISFHFIQTATIKIRIESLLEREYMKRSADHANVYEYVA